MEINKAHITIKGLPAPPQARKIIHKRNSQKPSTAAQPEKTTSPPPNKEYLKLWQRIVARQIEARQSRFQPSSDALSVKLKGLNGEYLYYNHGLTPEAFFSAVEEYLVGIKTVVDSIEINNFLPAMGIMKRHNPETNGIERCLFIPQRLLEIDPGLQETQPRFRLRSIDKVPTLYESISGSLKTLTPREEFIIRKRFGLRHSLKAHSLEEISKDFSLTGERIRQIEKKALKKLRHFSRSPSLSEAQRLISAVALWLMEKEFIISLEELNQALLDLGLSDVGTAKYLSRIIKLIKCVLGTAIDTANTETAFLDLKTGEAPPQLFWEENVVLCLDKNAYSRIISTFLESGKHMGPGKFQTSLRDKFGISIPPPKLRAILELNCETVKEKSRIHRLHTKESNRNAIRDAIKKAIGKNGPLHFKEIKLASIPSRSIHTELINNDEFILIGEGIYDLLENHPELKKISPFKPKVRKRSAVFAAICGILTEFERFCTISEIHQEIQRKGYGYGRSAIYYILHHDSYKSFFLSYTDNGITRYGLKSAKE